MPSSDEIKKVNIQIRGMQIPRIIAFADVVNRYTQKILKDKISWLRVSALIFLITRGGTLSPGQLARIMLRSNYSITKLIDGLEKDRLVKRYPDSKDRRSIKVKVTSKGLNYVISNLSNLAETERELKYWLSDDEREYLAATIRKLRDKLIEKISERYGLSADDKKTIFGKAHTVTKLICHMEKGDLMNKVKLDTGYITGTRVSQAGKEIYLYKGIPYAAPPTGELRWQPPQPAASWSGVRACTEFSTQAAQYPDPNSAEAAKKLPSSEDCLYLNVLTPFKKATDKLPVMVWLHGGGLRYGNGNYPLCNNLGLPLHGVVQVNINHRLGVMGLFAHPLLTRESPQHVSGNYMFLDMIAALQWVQRNIAAFGGDPDNVTIFGQSGGGLKVAALMSTPLANGLFHRAIIESGGRYFDTVPLNKMEVFGEKLFRKLGVDKEKEPLSAVRKLPWKTIINTDQELNVEMGPEYMFMGPWQVVHDGWFLPDTLVNMFQNGQRNQVPYLIVANKGELTGPGSLIADMMIKDYLRLLTGPNTANSRGYAAVFDRVPEGWRREGCVAAHGMELHYVFGALDDAEVWAAAKAGYTSSGAKSSVPTVSETDRKVAENIETIWTNFARTGNPGVKGLIEWPAWDRTTDKYLLITDPLQVKPGFSDLTKIKADTSKQTIF